MLIATKEGGLTMKKSILLALGLSFSAPAALAGGSLGGSGLGLQGGSMGGGGLGSPSLQGGSIGGGGLGLQGGTVGGGSGGSSVMQRSAPDNEINSLNVDGGLVVAALLRSLSSSGPFFLAPAFTKEIDR